MTFLDKLNTANRTRGDTDRDLDLERDADRLREPRLGLDRGLRRGLRDRLADRAIASKMTRQATLGHKFHSGTVVTSPKEMLEGKLLLMQIGVIYT